MSTPPRTPNGKTAKLENSTVTPEELAAIKKSVLGKKEVAPSTRQQSAANQNWRTLFDAPADPFNTERIPISYLRQMRRDPMIGFALHFIKVPLIRAEWYIQCEEAQIAAFVDYALRRIYNRLVSQYMLSLDFGFSGIVKRFVVEQVPGVYFDPNDDTQTGDKIDNPLAATNAVPVPLRGSEKPIWSEGSVDPVIWKPFVALPPEEVEAIYDKSTGEFAGIKFTPRVQISEGGAASKQEQEFDVYHSLWITNERDNMHGNIYGYPRTGYAFQYWWSYWQRHALADRHFEKDADPPTMVRYPEGSYIDPDGNQVPHRELALAIGDEARSGSSIAIPSRPYTSFEDRASNTYEWDIGYLEGGGNFSHFNETFQYLDVMKLRSVFVPEQALIEGRGGTSSRNVAEEFGSSFQESQAVLMADFDEHVNRFVIPQLVALNFPEFTGRVEKKTRGFSAEDVETVRQLVQLVGQQNTDKLGVNIREALQRLGVPMLSEMEQAAEEQRLAEQTALGAVPTVEPIAGQQAGIVPTGGENGSPAGNANGNNGTASSAFSYVQPRERIEVGPSIFLADDFVSTLPPSDHYQDRILLGYGQQIWQLYNELYRGQYEDFFQYLSSLDSFDDPDDEGTLELADINKISAKVKKLIGRWQGDTTLWNRVTSQSVGIFRKAMQRAGYVALRKANMSAEQWNATDDNVSDWMDNHLANTITSISQTVRGDLETTLIRMVYDSEEELTPREITTQLRQHFADFPDWMANRLARTELRDLYNASTLLAGNKMGIKQAQAFDALAGDTDEDCEDRDGKVFSISDALQEDEHPNGTLGWRLLPNVQNLSIEMLDETEGLLASYDPETETIKIDKELDESKAKQYIHLIGDRLSRAE